MDVKQIECTDGTLILSNNDDVNELLKKGWEVIEIGMIIFNSTPSMFAPVAIGFRLKKIKSFFKDEDWGNILVHSNNMYRFKSREHIKENVSAVKVVSDLKEKELLKKTGWILIKKCEMNLDGNSSQYAFGLLKD